MHTCRVCGKPTPNYREYSPSLADIFGESGYSTCDECRRKGHILYKWENEQCTEERLICPYCESSIDDPWQYEEDEAPHRGHARRLERGGILMSRGFIELYDENGYMYIVSMDKIVSVDVAGKKIWFVNATLEICDESMNRLCGRLGVDGE